MVLCDVKGNGEWKGAAQNASSLGSWDRVFSSDVYNVQDRTIGGLKSYAYVVSFQICYEGDSIREQCHSRM